MRNLVPNLCLVALILYLASISVPVTATPPYETPEAAEQRRLQACSIHSNMYGIAVGSRDNGLSPELALDQLEEFRYPGPRPSVAEMKKAINDVYFDPTISRIDSASMAFTIFSACANHMTLNYQPLK